MNSQAAKIWSGLNFSYIDAQVIRLSMYDKYLVEELKKKKKESLLIQ